MKTVTKEWIHEHKTKRGGWTNAQLVQLGEPWPPVRGWIDRAIGREIDDEAARLFEHYGKERPRGADRSAIRAKHARQTSHPVHKPKRKKNLAPKLVLHAGVDVASTEFLSSYAWRQLRMRVLSHYGPRCMCCGATPDSGAVMNVDHIKPRKTYPHLALDFDNLQVLCHECNHGKGNWDSTDWRPREEIDPQVTQFLRSIIHESF